VQYDPNNKIVKLCAEGMALEGEGRCDEALQIFMQAWEQSSSDFERFTSAHYVARHQPTIEKKLEWDKRALELALKIDDANMSAALPSLYLNIAKCYEDLQELEEAEKNYETALSFCAVQPEDGYGKMIRGGIVNGLERIKMLIGNQAQM
jgi:rifampin ADP-ribosylating transferase